MVREITFPYLNHKISEKSKECAIENILFHLIPYIFAIEDEEKLKKYKAMVSFDLMNSIADDKEDSLNSLMYRSKVAKKQKCSKELFDIYKCEYESYITNGGAQSLIYGYTYENIKNIIKEETSPLLITYFFVLNLLRLYTYCRNKFSRNKAKEMVHRLSLTIQGSESLFSISGWGMTNINEALSHYLSRSHIIFGYIHTLITHNIINIENLSSANDLISNTVKNVLASFTEEKCYSLTSEIIGYALYVENILGKEKGKHAESPIQFISIPSKAIKKFGFKEIEPILKEFTDKEKELLSRKSNTNTVRRHKKGHNWAE